MMLKAPFKNTPLLLACMAGTVMLVTACSEKAATPPQAAVSVGTYTVTKQAVTLTTDLPGRTNAWLSAEVRPQVSGILLKRLFTEGSDVKIGQQLYQIDPAPYQAAFDRAQAQLVTSQQLANRDQKLLADNAVSQQSVADATASYRQAAADVETARINLAYTKVFSPISGFIGRSSVTQGALVTTGQSSALATVRQLDPIYVDVTETSNEMLRLRREWAEGKLRSTGENMTSVHLTLDDGSHYPLAGSMKFSEVNVDQGTGTVTMRAVFPNPKHVLLPGMFVHAQLDEGVAENAVLAPEQAIARDTTGKPYVWLVKNGKVDMHSVTVSRTIGNTWLVTSGLNPGDVVVAEGLQNLSQDMQVSAAPADNVHIDLGDSVVVQDAPAAATVAAAASATSGASSPTVGG